MVSSLDQLFEAILPATVGKKGLSLHAAEMKTVVFDNLLLFFFLAHQETCSVCFQDRSSMSLCLGQPYQIDWFH